MKTIMRFFSNIRWKVVLAIIMSISSLSFLSCTNLNKTIADEVCVELRDRYGVEFVAVKIGDRLNTDSATLILYPKDNPELRIVAKIDRSTRIVTDDYYQQIICDRLRREIEKSLYLHQINATARVFAIISEGKKPDSSDMSFPDLLHLCDFDYYLLFLAIEDSIEYTEELVRSYISELCTQENISIGVYCYVFDAQQYQLCKDELLENPLISETQMRQFNPINSRSYLINAEDGE